MVGRVSRHIRDFGAAWMTLCLVLFLIAADVLSTAAWRRPEWAVALRPDST